MPPTTTRAPGGVVTTRTRPIRFAGLEGKRTAQKTVDWFGNSIYTLNQSSREVDEYRLHPNRIKNLECGQGYLVQDATVAGINFATIPDAVFSKLISPQLRQQRSTPAGQGGLGLYDLFIQEQGCSA